MKTILIKRKRIALESIFILLFSSLSLAQSVGINTITPDNDATLDLYGTNMGFLPTRLHLSSTDDASPLNQHVAGMVTYNLNSSVVHNDFSVYEGFYYNDGVKWNQMGPNTVSVGDIKYSLDAADHKGWYLLDGRNISLLPETAQNNANAVGISFQVPDCTDRFLKTTNGTEAIQLTGGTNTIVLNQTNLPDITYTVATAVAGNHSHSYTDFYNPAKSLGLATNILPLVPLISETVGTNDIVPANLFAATGNGNHSHTVTVSSGGSGVPVNATPRHLVVNTFIYLGE